jgi:hypothetical protein
MRSALLYTQFVSGHSLDAKISSLYEVKMQSKHTVAAVTWLLSLVCGGLFVCNPSFAETAEDVCKPNGGSVNSPEIFMQTPPVHEEKEMGGFYVGELTDGTVFNANLFYSSARPGQPARIINGSIWYQNTFDGRVIPIFVKSRSDSNPLLLSFDAKRGGDNVGSWGEWISTRSPTDGFGRFLSPGETTSLTITGQMSAGLGLGQGTWTNNLTHQKQIFHLKRRIVYRSLAKSWPFCFDVVKPMFADFKTIFPELPYAIAQQAVLKDAALCLADLACENVISVVGLSNRLLTLRVWQSDTSAGAHEESNSKYSVYRVDGEHLEPLGLGDVIDKTGDCGSRLQHLVGQRLEAIFDRQGYGVVPADARAAAADFASSFIVAPDQVSFHFQPTDLNVSNSVGEIFVTLSFTELKGCVRPWISK